MNLHGGDGPDSLRGFSGSDTLAGGGGNDIIRGFGGDDFLFGNTGDDTITGQTGDDFIHGNDGRDVLLGGLGNDTIDGGPGNDHVYGGPGNDHIVGGSFGDPTDLDTVFGGNGDDILSTGVTGGSSFMWGGQGHDIFDFNMIDPGTDGFNIIGYNQINDFQLGTDKIDITLRADLGQHITLDELLAAGAISERIVYHHLSAVINIEKLNIPRETGTDLIVVYDVTAAQLEHHQNLVEHS